MINSTIQKVLLIIMLSRVRENYEAGLLPFQWGFRRSRGTGDGVFLARQITTKKASSIYGCFIDCRLAYDWLDRPTLWKILRLRMGSEKLVGILERMYASTAAKLDGVTDPINVEVGVRQGGQESCVCFNYMLDVVIRVALAKIEEQFPGAGIEHNYNIKMECTDRSQRMEHAANGVSKSAIIMYADDILVLGRTCEELEGMMNVIRDTFSAYGLTLAAEKTVSMTWNTPEETQTKKSLITVGGEKLDNVREFRYLGHWLTDNPKKPQYISQQISSAWAKWAEVKHILTDHEVKLWIRVKMLEAMIRSRLTYAVQSERLRRAEKIKLDAVWTNFCRRMIKGGFRRKKDKGQLGEEDEEPDWSFCLSNGQVQKICRTTNVSEFCQRQHIKYIAHITRMPNNSELKKWLFTKSEHRYVRDQWKEIGQELGMDEIQVRRMLFNKEELNTWLRSRETPWAH